MEVAYQESNPKIFKDKFHYGGDHGKFFYDWGEVFVISFDFEASFYPPGVTNILHIYDYGLDYYDYEPEEAYGYKIPGYKTIQP